MAKIIIGIDPDSKKHGVSVFVDGKLQSLKVMHLLEIYEYIKETNKYENNEISVHMENVKAISATFDRAWVKGAKQAISVGVDLGRCQQSQIELERMFESIGLKVNLHKISKCWKDSKTGCAALKDLGWTGRSNEDTRSAAYFGYLGVKKVI